MGRNLLWLPPRFGFRTIFVQHFPLWFVIFRNTYLTSYADDTTPYVFSNKIEEVFFELKEIAEIFAWLIKNKLMETMKNAN